MHRQVRRRIERSEKIKEKALAQKPIQKKWIFIALGAVVAIVAIVTSIAAYHNFDWTVARIDGTPIRMSDLGHALWEVEHDLTDEYFDMYPGEFFVDFDRPLRGNLTFADVLRQEAAINIAVSFLLEAEAELRGVGLTDEDRRNIQWEIHEGWGNDFRELHEVGIRTHQQLTDVFERQQIRFNVLDALLSELDDAQRIEKAIQLDVLWAAQHILVEFERFYFDEIETLAEALSLHARAIAGEDFEQLMLMYSDDQNPDEPPDLYTFTTNVMVSEFEQATRALAIGEISAPIRSQFGFHIIRRAEPDPDPFGIMGDLDGAVRNALIGQFYEEARARIEFLPALSRVDVG